MEKVMMGGKQDSENEKPHDTLIAKKKIYAVLLLIFIVSLYGRYSNVAKDGLSWDEFYSYRLANTSIKESWNLASVGTNPPLLYFAVRLFCAVFGYSEGALRAVSLVSSALLTALIFLFLYRKTENIYAGLLGCLLYLFSPLAEYWSHFSRPYALLSLVSFASFYCAAEYAERHRKRYIIMFTFLNIVLIYAHYYALFMLITLYLFLILFYIPETNSVIVAPPVSARFLWMKSKFRIMLLALFSGVIVVLAWLPWIFPFLRQYHRVHQKYWIPRPNLSALYDMIHAHFHYNIIIFVLALLPVFFIKENKRKLILQISFVAIIFVLTAFLYSYVIIPVFLAKRIGIVVLPFVIVLLTIILFESRIASVIKASIIAVFMAYAIYSFIDYNRTYPHLEDWRSSIHYLSRAIKDDEKIYYILKSPPPVVEYYAKELTNRISDSSERRGSFWLVSPPVFFSASAIKNYFANYALIEEHGVFEKLQSPVWHFAPAGKTLWFQGEADNRKLNGKEVNLTLSKGWYVIKGRITSEYVAEIVLNSNGNQQKRMFPPGLHYLVPPITFNAEKSVNQVRIYFISPEGTFQWLSFQINNR